jgi:hypothetical protein
VLALTAGAAGATPSTWTIEASPNRGAGFNYMHDVSCPSATFCMAVGQITPDAYFLNMGMRWNGRTWKLANPRSPKRSENSLSSVACTGPSFCLAVGVSWLLGGPPRTSALVERWDGTGWSIVANPSGTRNTQLSGVACPGPTTCFLVGNRATAKGGGVFERWDNGTLSALPEAGLQSAMTDLDCPSVTMCVAVGATDENFAELRIQTYDGAHWTDAGAAVPSDTSDLSSVSCASTTSCMATGGYYDEDARQWSPLAETWNGTTWTKQPNPPTDYYGAHDVACPAVNDCVIVGTAGAGTAKFTTAIALTWDGSQWADEAVPRAGHYSNSLDAVSCWGPTQCRAVGYWTHDHVRQTLALGGT